MASVKHLGVVSLGSVSRFMSQLGGFGDWASKLELLPNPLPGLQEALPPASGSSGTAEHRPAGGPAPDSGAEATETAGECLGGAAAPAAQGSEVRQPCWPSWPDCSQVHSWPKLTRTKR